MNTKNIEMNRPQVSKSSGVPGAFFVRIFISVLFLLSILSVVLPRKGHSKAEQDAVSAQIEPQVERQIDPTLKAAEDAELLANLEKLVSEVEKKKHDVEMREQALVDQEKAIHDREEDLDKKMKELKSIREGLNATFDQQKKNSEEKVVKMVTVFETMQPKAASKVFETLDDWLAVEVFKRMDVKKVAKIMNLMEQNRSAKLSELMTGYYKPPIAAAQSSQKLGRSVASDAPGAAAENAKIDSKSEKPAAIKSADSAAASKELASKGSKTANLKEGSSSNDQSKQ